nr:hypothetical protein [Neorhizobium tomejilense]
MDSVDKVLLAAMVNLVRQVPWGPNRDQLEVQAKAFAREASFESGWDNYSTAAWLNWRSRLFNLAAQARYPRTGDTLVASMNEQLFDRLVHEISLWEDDEDVGEWTRQVGRSLSSAISSVLPDDALDAVIDELAQNGYLQSDPERLKVFHRHPDMPTEQHMSLSAFGSLL